MNGLKPIEILVGNPVSPKFSSAGDSPGTARPDRAGRFSWRRRTLDDDVLVNGEPPTCWSTASRRPWSSG
jgi:hypothetical protein